MASVSVKFISQKVSKVRWQPGDLQGLKPTNTFITGSWDNDENWLCLWRIPASREHNTNNRLGTGVGRYSPTVADGDDPGSDLADDEPKLVCQERHKGDVTDIKFVSQDIFLASSSSGSVEAFRIAPGTEKMTRGQKWEGLHRYRSRTCPCTCLAVSGTDVAAGGEDGRINVLRLEHRHAIRTIDDADSSTINALTYLKSSQVVTVNSTGQMKIWDLRQPGSQPAKVFLLTGDKTALHCVDRHPTQSHLVAAGSQDSVLNMWDMRKEKFPVTLFDGHQGPIWEVKFHPTFSDHLFTCSEDGSVLHWSGSGSSSTTSQMSAASQSNRAGSAIYPSLGLGGVPATPATGTPPPASPWLTGDQSGQVDIRHMLPANVMPVNSLDADGDRLVCGTDGEAVFIVRKLGLR